MLIDLVQLRTFVAVAEEQHLTRAAERLHLSQSAASAHVRAVEDHLGTQLFIRTNRSLELTRAGQMLLRRARLLLSEAAQFTSFAREISGRIEGRLAVGANSYPASSRIGDIVAQLRARHPLLHVDLRAQPSLGALQALKTWELDIALMLVEPVEADFSFHQVGTVRFRVAGPVAWKDSILGADWAALAALPWISATGGSSQAASVMLRRLFADRGLTLNSVVHFDSAVLGRSLVQAGLGMMLMREEEALQGERDGVLALSPLASEAVGLHVTHLASRGHDPLIRAFIEATQAVWPELRPVA